jgi:hypothetical protein
VDVVPTFTTSNARICLLLSNGKYGALRIEDAERLQVGGGGRVGWQLFGFYGVALRRCTALDGGWVVCLC